MSSDFIDQLAKELNLSEAELDVLNQADVRTAEDVDSLLSAFPSLAGRVRVPLLADAVRRRLGAAYVAGAESRRANPPRNGFGADAPPGSLFTRGTIVGVVPRSAFAPAPSLPGAIDLRVQPWPVRNQEGRGTCVAFATTACVEHMQFAAEGRATDYSEQFLYWAIKDHSSDPNKNQDSTLLQFARETLRSDGTCHEALCAYDGNIPMPVSGPNPSGAAKADAAAHRFTPGTFMQGPSGAARTVLQLLNNGRPVAVSLPIFTNPADPNGPNNWMTSVGYSYGRVFNPPPGAVASQGHCVCVTGFVPDAGEPNGGYFIFRNSWDHWAAAAPSPGSSYSPERGYGEISATYINSYCWELLQV